MMDNIPVLPPRKKPNFLRANREQVKILKAGFAASDISSKEHIAALSEATGLAPKWISSWFTRERKKHGLVMPRGKGRAKNDTSAAMSREEITAFKSEHQDSALPPTEDALAVDPEPEQKPDLSKRSKTAKKPQKKSKNDASTCRPSAPSSPLESPFVFSPLAPRRTSPAVPPQPQVQAKAALDSVNTSPSSTFILRPMVTVMYNPDGSRSDLSVSLGLSNMDSGTVSTLLASSSDSTAITDHSFLVPDYNHDPSVTFGSSSKQLERSPAQTAPPSPGNKSDGNKGDSRNKTPTTQDSPRDPLRPSAQSLSTDAAQTQQQTQEPERMTQRPLRPLLPLHDPSHTDLPYQDPFTRNLFAPPHPHPHTSNAIARATKENQPPVHDPNGMVHQLRPQLQTTVLKPTMPAPLLSYTNLRLTSSGTHSYPQQPQYLAYPPAIGYPPQAYAQPPPGLQQLQPQPPSLFQAYPTAYAPGFQHPYPHPYPTLLDPTTTPLRHLSVLADVPSLPADEVLHRLLDERLAREDPFQAAMGLVFVSRLGLGWDCM